MNEPLLGYKKFIGTNNLVVYFRNIYEIWYRGFSNIILDQLYNLITFGSICILYSLLFPLMKIPCIICFMFQLFYISRYIFQLNELRKLHIYYDSWEETLFHLLDLQEKYQFCRIKPILSQNDIKEYILFYDKYLSLMIQKKIIPFPNLIYAKIYHWVVIDFFLPQGKIEKRSEKQIHKRFRLFSLFCIILFPISILFVFWHLMRYFELFYGNIKSYQWSDYAFYYYRDNNEYKHQTLQRLYHLDENAYNLVHYNDKPIVYMLVRITSFICANILFYFTSEIIVDNDIVLMRWIGLLTLIITFCQKWMNNRIDNVEKDIQILSSHLEDYNISKKKFTLMYINNLNFVVYNIISFFQIIWYFLKVYPNYSLKLLLFFSTNNPYYFPVGNIKYL